MKKILTILPLALFATGCAQAPRPVAVAVNDSSLAAHPPAVLVSPADAPAPDSDMIEAVQRDLKALGYAVGKPGELTDPLFQRAILAFEKDQGLTQDGNLTPTLVDRIRQVRVQLPKAFPVVAQDGEMLVYSDGSERRQPLGLLPAPPAGLVSDASANFLQPLRPGLTGSYHLGRRAKDGSFTIVASVTCKIGRVVPLNAPLGLFDSLMVECGAEGKDMPAMQWRSFYAIKLGLVIRQEAAPAAGGARDLIAVRPVTTGWPSAARTGLDWAITHALETPVSTTPVLWSSTAVPPHFEIHAAAALSPHDAGLPGGATPSCRRFDLMQTGEPVRHYPGIACRNAKGSWSLAQSRVELASPASGFARQSEL
jgi:Putative peptidoglycan binding domain